MTLFGQSRRGPGRGGDGGAGAHAPFSIDDAFDIPEDDDDLRGASSAKPAPSIIRNGQLRLSSEGAKYRTADPVAGDNGDGASVADSASLIQSGDGDGSAEGGHAAGGYYEGPPRLKYWWHHPKIRSNPRVVLAACLLVVLGLGLISVGVAVLCAPKFSDVQGVVFVIAGVICFLPGAYHIGYIYLAVKGKRGFEFNHLPLFNN